MRCLLLLLVASVTTALRPVARRAALGQALGGIAVTLLPNAATAISGGGKDYAEATIKNQVFDGQKLDNKDFSGADATGADFTDASIYYDIKMNDIARVKIRSTKPLFSDDYTTNRVTGSLILIDEATNETVAAGMIR